MDPRLISLMRRYLLGEASRRELGELVEGYDIWNGWQDSDVAVQDLRDVAGELELLVCDIDEDIRDESELRDTIARLLRKYPETAPKTPVSS